MDGTGSSLTQVGDEVWGIMGATYGIDISNGKLIVVWKEYMSGRRRRRGGEVKEGGEGGGSQ